MHHQVIDFMKNANGLVHALQLQFLILNIHLNCEIDSDHFYVSMEILELPVINDECAHSINESHYLFSNYTFGYFSHCSSWTS